MSYFVFDTETTGIGAGTVLDKKGSVSVNDEVIQFAGLLLDESLRLKKVISFHCYTAVPIYPKAQAVNHLDHQKLMKYSGGRTFEDFFLNQSDLHSDDITWVGYNVKFDMRIINNTLKQNGLDVYDFGTCIKTLRSRVKGRCYFDLLESLAMRNGGIRMKLVQAAKSLPYTEQQLNAMYGKLLQLTNNKSDLTFHDALYDSLVTWLLLVQNEEWC